MNLFFIHIAFVALSFASLNKPANIAVLLVDPQETFYERGSLAVPGANSTIMIEFVKELYNLGYPLIASQDSHQTGHISFEQWPVHGLKKAKWNKKGLFEGDDLIEPLNKMVEYIQPKGESINADSYSAFEDDDGRKTGLASYLHKKQYETLIIFGEAGNYCLRTTIKDALRERFNVILISDMTHYIPNTLETEMGTIQEYRDNARYSYFRRVTSFEFLNDATEILNFEDERNVVSNFRGYDGMNSNFEDAHNVENCPV